MNNENQLKNLISSIEIQEVELSSTSFNVNENIRGNFIEAQLKRNFKINSLNINFGERRNHKDDEFQFIKITYIGKHIDSLIIDKSEEKELLNINFSYSIILVLNETSNFFNLDEKIKIDTIKLYAESTGKLVIFPYIRYLIDSLSKSANIIVPPISPIMIK